MTYQMTALVCEQIISYNVEMYFKKSNTRGKKQIIMFCTSKKEAVTVK